MEIKPSQNQIASWFDLLAILLLLMGSIFIWTSYNEGYSYGTSATFQGLLLIIIVHFFLWVRGGSWADLGLGAWPSRETLISGVVGGLIIASLMAVSSLVLAYLPWSINPQAASEQLKSLKTWQEVWPIMVAVTIMAPLSEEIFFRGYCLPLFTTKWGSTTGSLAGALFFALMHFDPWRLLPLTLAGWLLNRLFRKTSSLWAPIVAHSIWNFMLAMLLFAATGLA